MINTIFTFYVLLLPLLPCSDIVACYNSQLTEICRTTEQDHQHNREHCTPFCSCSCCGSIYATALYSAKNISTKLCVDKRKWNAYSNANLPSKFYDSIWQPPKVV
ncbi:DUF6660 family protein [Ferruginibacter sp. SUN002]|uniref:DUF6660 family protein n=1 Tax=Ferruginibacter sp. SUN002 TaxID=2937789 RepID=UPI003D36849F